MFFALVIDIQKQVAINFLTPPLQIKIFHFIVWNKSKSEFSCILLFDKDFSFNFFPGFYTWNDLNKE